MTQKFPPKPWNVDDTFINGETGVIYVFTGEQWIASGGPEVEGVYLPLVGGKLSEPGNLNVEGQLKVSGENEFKVEFDDGSNFLRVRPDNSNVVLKGSLDADDHVRAGEFRSTKLTSGQSSNLQIYRGYGANEQRKMLIGSDSVNLDVSLKLVGSTHKDIQVQNGTKIDTGGDEIITFGSSGAFYRGAITQPDHLINKAYADVLVEDGPFLPLTGGELTGQLTIKKNTQVALEIVGDNNNSQIKFWSSGAVALQNYTAFKDNELVTKAYVDGAVDLSNYLPLTGGQMTGPITSNRGAGDYALRIEQGGAHKLTIWNDGVVESTRTGFNDNHLVTKKYVDDNAGGITPGDQVAKTNGTSVQVGGFYISLGNLYVRVS